MKRFSKATNIILILIVVLQVIAAFYFCAQKQGFHYDEYYSYYSSNVTYGLTPTDNDWMNGNAIRDEFRVTEGKGFQYGMVRLMQTYDVHPPLYYFVLHTVCSITPGVFSKWQGIAVNMLFFVASIIMLGAITSTLSKNNQMLIASVLAVYGFSPAIISGITFIRMYMMLTFLCFVGLYIAIRAIRDAKYDVTFYILTAVTTYLGFMTHYYYAVFMFFVAAYMCIYLFINRDTRKQSFIYGGSVVSGMLLGVVTYPACLSHIFRGYRGTEAIGEFVSATNLSSRMGLFVGLLDEYVMYRSFYLMALGLIMILATAGYSKKRKSGSDSSEDLVEANTKAMLGLCVTVTLGYFLVVMKTALTNAEEAVRYEMPIYGIMILIILYAFYAYVRRFTKLVYGVIVAVVVVMQIVGFSKGKVLFLYPDDAADYAWASEHQSDTIAYIYNYTNQWMIWDDSCELMNYDRIFFINMENTDDIVDKDITNAQSMYIFSVRSDSANEQMQKIIDANPNVDTTTKIRELKYVDVYEVR